MAKPTLPSPRYPSIADRRNETEERPSEWCGAILSPSQTRVHRVPWARGFARLVPYPQAFPTERCLSHRRPVDPIDYAIYRYLSPDGLIRFWGSRRLVDPRVSTREIAEKVKLSEAGVRARIHLSLIHI